MNQIVLDTKYTFFNKTLELCQNYISELDIFSFALQNDVSFADRHFGSFIK